MKLVLVIYNSVVDEEVMEILGNLGLKSYTKWTRVLGEGKAGGPRLDDHIWPGSNNVLAVAVDETASDLLLQRVQELKDAMPDIGIKLFVVPLEKIL